MKKANKNNKNVNNSIGDNMHKVNTNHQNIRTDLILEKEIHNKKSKVHTLRDIKITYTQYQKYNYTTIYFDDITDKDNFNNLLEILVNELKKYLKPTNKETYLVIGLGNKESTPDSLGPKVLNNILITRYLFLLGDVEEGYSNVCSFEPNVTGNTGIETFDIVETIIKQTNATKVIIIDSLKANTINNLIKTIQITDSGISPGSGINNNRKELSPKTLNTDIIAIGVPTVVDIKSLHHDIKDNLIVTPTNIDFIIEKLALLIGKSINMSLHKDFIRQNNY